MFELRKSWLNVASISNQNINEEDNYTIEASESNGPQNLISGSWKLKLCKQTKEVSTFMWCYFHGEILLHIDLPGMLIFALYKWGRFQHYDISFSDNAVSSAFIYAFLGLRSIFMVSVIKIGEHY